MNFSDYIIDEEDYKFFDTLPKDEKLLFLYDLICEDAFGPGSVEPLPPSAALSTSMSLLDKVSEFEDKLYNIISANINETAKVNLLIINDTIVINSNSEDFLKEAVSEMLEDGVILTNVPLTPKTTPFFHQQKYCKMYVVLGKVSNIIY